MLGSLRLIPYPLAQAVPLLNSDQTITPGASQKSRYIMPPGVQTAERNITVSNSGVTASLICDIVRPEPVAFALVIKNAGGTTIHTIPAGVAASAEVYFNGAAWVISIWWFVDGGND